MLTPSRMFYTATISVGELGVLFSLSVYVVSFVLRWFFYGGVLVVLVIVLLRVWSNGRWAIPFVVVFELFVWSVKAFVVIRVLGNGVSWVSRV